MSDFKKCVDDGVAAGEITQDQANEYGDLFQGLVDQYNKQLGPGPAQTKAGIDAAQVLRKQVIERQRTKVMQIVSWKKAIADIEQYRTAAGLPDLNLAAKALFEEDRQSKFRSVAQLEKVIQSSATRKLDQYLKTFRRDVVGRVRQKAQLNNLVKEIFEEGSTDDVAAREMAQAWKFAAEYLRKRFNAAGGAIPSRADWGMPQSHHSLKVRQAGYEKWRKDITPLLDYEKMVDFKTGLKFTEDSIEIALKDVYDTISSDGMSKVKDGLQVARGKSMAKQHADHRFLVFSGGENWLKYQKLYGNDNPFDVMMGHISNMSRDIAFMERLGPNPYATKNAIKQYLEKKSGGGKALDKARATGAALDTFYNIQSGKSNMPINGFFAVTMAGLRQVLQSAQLGAASISAITDVNFQRIARQMNGLPQTSQLMQYVGFLWESLPGMKKEERSQLAIRLGLTAEGWSTMAAAQMRYVGDMSGPEATRRLADFVMRASFLSPWTQAGKWAFGMEFLGTLADNVGKRFDELDPTFRSAMERYGIGEGKWDIMRSTELYEYKGAKFLRAEDIEFRTDIDPRLARDIATDLMSMVETETNFAVPSSSMRGRAALTGDVPPGTVIGEIGRSFAMYKNFGVTLLNTHMARAWGRQGGINKTKALANLVISTTLMGALAMMMKEMSKGRDPREMFVDGKPDVKFWGAAILQGGGFGIFGDFLFADRNRYGGGIGSTIAGPVSGITNDVLNLTLGNLFEAAAGEETNAADEAIRFAARYTPGVSLWYGRLAFERMVVDQARLWVDPQHNKRIRRVIRKNQREYNQEYWWEPGQFLPGRAPDIGKAFGN